MKFQVLDHENNVSGEIEFSDAVFNVDIRPDIVSRVVLWQLAKRRSGNHSVKGKSDVHGTTRKFVRQKGSGGARHGSKKAAQFRGGGIVFGPVVRDHSYDLPKKIRKLGLKLFTLFSKSFGNTMQSVMFFSSISFFAFSISSSEITVTLKAPLSTRFLTPLGIFTAYTFVSAVNLLPIVSAITFPIILYIIKISRPGNITVVKNNLLSPKNLAISFLNTTNAPFFTQSPPFSRSTGQRTRPLSFCL